MKVGDKVVVVEEPPPQRSHSYEPRGVEVGMKGTVEMILHDGLVIIRPFGGHAALSFWPEQLKHLT